MIPPIGASVIVTGLSTRIDLEGVIAQVIANTTAADERVAIRLPSGEQIRVRLQNVRSVQISADVAHHFIR